MEYSNGIVGDMCIHMFDAVRWMLGLGWPKRVSSSGGILVEKGSKANIADTQTASFDYGDLCVTWQHRTWGSPPDPKYPWGITFYGEKGTLRISVFSYDFESLDGSEKAIHRDVAYEFRSSPKTRRKRTWSGTSPRRSVGICKTCWQRWRAAAGPWRTSKRAISRPPVRSWRTCRWGSAGRSTGTRKRSRWWATTKPTGFSSGRTGNPGRIPEVMNKRGRGAEQETTHGWWDCATLVPPYTMHRYATYWLPTPPTCMRSP